MKFTKKNLINFPLKLFLIHNTHLGHNIKKRNPLNNTNILGIRKKNDIFNTEKTLYSINQTLPIIIDTIANKGKILIISHNKSLIPIVQTELNKFEIPIIIGQWIYGTLTNFNHIQLKTDNKTYTQHADKLTRLPDLIILLNQQENNNYILNEINKLKIPTIALTDSNIAPTNSMYPIPFNDDSLSALTLYIHILTKTLNSGFKKHILSLKK